LTRHGSPPERLQQGSGHFHTHAQHDMNTKMPATLLPRNRVECEKSKERPQNLTYCVRQMLLEMEHTSTIMPGDISLVGQVSKFIRLFERRKARCLDVKLSLALLKISHKKSVALDPKIGSLMYRAVRMNKY